MNMRTCLMAASLCLVAGMTFAQGPEFPSRNFSGNESNTLSFQDATPIPGIGIAPNRQRVYESATDGAIVVPGADGAILPQLDGAPVPVAGCCSELFDRVCYKDKCKMAPCAEPMIVSVLDPCSRKCDCETKCVLVKICVPTCGCPKVKVTRSGRHTRYDFGKYAVDIFSNRNGTVTVDYDA